MTIKIVIKMCYHPQIFLRVFETLRHSQRLSVVTNFHLSTRMKADYFFYPVIRVCFLFPITWFISFSWIHSYLIFFFSLFTSFYSLLSYFSSSTFVVILAFLVFFCFSWPHIFKSLHFLILRTENGCWAIQGMKLERWMI